MAEQNGGHFLISWTIKGFDLQDGPYYLSPEFKAENLGNSEWRLDLCKKHDGFVHCIFCSIALLNFNRLSTDAQINYRFELLSSKDTTVKISKNFTLTLRRSNSSAEYGLVYRNELSELLSTSSENSLTVRCYMAYATDRVPLISRDNAFINCEAETNIVNNSKSFNWNLKFKNFIHCTEKKHVTISTIPIEIMFRYISGELQIEISSNVKEDDLVHRVSCTVVLSDASCNEIFEKTCVYFISKDNKTMPNAPSFTRPLLEEAQCFTRGKIRVDICFTHEKSSSLKYYEREKNKKINNKKSVKRDRNLQLNSDCLSDLQHDLHKLFLDKTFADVKLRVDNEIITAHRGILAARSPVFRAMFELHNNTGIATTLWAFMMTSQPHKFIDVSDVDLDTFKLILEYIYTGIVSEMDEEKAISLLSAARKFQVMSLVKKCMKFLESVMRLENVCKLLLIADKENHEELKSSAVNYIVKNLAVTNTLSSSEWLQLENTNANLAIEVLEKLAHFNRASKEKSTSGSSKGYEQDRTVNSQQGGSRAGSSKDGSKENEKSSSQMVEKEGRQMKIL